MIYNNIVNAKFLDRPNRFIAHCSVNGKEETVHVKNTGRCKEILIPGTTCYLQHFNSETRKTNYDLISAYKKDVLINIDSQAPNKVVLEWLHKQNVSNIKPEYTFGDSRLDFKFEKYNKCCLMEVKGVTLEIDGKAYFPDAPTIRGVKHLNELAKASREGYTCFLAFVIQLPKINMVYPYLVTHPEFGEALENAEKNGVHILYLGCKMTENEIYIERTNMTKEAAAWFA